MSAEPVRRAAVAGSWYPGTAIDLTAEVDRYLAAVTGSRPTGVVRAVVAPHAGLVYSGPVAAWAYRAVSGADIEVVVLIGPSHRVAFDGVALYPRGAFDSPLGRAPVAEDVAAALLDASPVVQALPAAHAREHSIEMQMPFIRRVLPDSTIVPMLMGRQSDEVVAALAEALATVLAGRRALMVASSDLSHYLDARTAARTDGRVLDLVSRFDADGLAEALRVHPEHACGGGPIVAVMRAARALGARAAHVLRYADSGDVSGDKSAVVGYMAAAFADIGPDTRDAAGSTPGR